MLLSERVSEWVFSLTVVFSMGHIALMKYAVKLVCHFVCAGYSKFLPVTGLSNQQLDEQLELCPELVICWK